MASLLNTVRDLERLRQIVGVLARHGFGQVARQMGLGNLLGPAGETGKSTLSAAERIRLVLEELGPTFVKLGQILSTRSDLLPEDLIRELSKLQEQVSPLPFDDIKLVLEEQLGAGIGELFVSFEHVPLASASIAQVHRAVVTHNDQSHHVAVKVQRPNIAGIIDRDVDLLYWLAHGIERSMPELKVFSPVAMVGEFDKAIHAELDFMLEADHAERFADNFQGYGDVCFPKVYRDVSSKRVLTLEFIDGHHIDKAIAQGYSGEIIARKAVQVVIKQIFEDGFFHADPHPGNLLICGEAQAPTIALLDLGLVGRLSPALRDKTVDLLIAAMQRDSARLADVMCSMARNKGRIDRLQLESDVAVLSERYLGKKLKHIALADFVRDLLSCARRNHLEVPAEFVMMGKALVTIEGIGKRIYPDLDILEEARPYLTALVRDRYSVENMGRDVLRQVLRMRDTTTNLPYHVEAIFEDLREGRLTLQLRDPKLAQAIERLGRRIFAGLIVTGWIIAAALLFVSNEVLWSVACLVAGLSYASLQAIGLTLRNPLRKKD